jgi:GAF domain-containing protein
MLDDENRFAVLRAGRGEAGRAMLERGHKFDAANARQSMVGWVCVNRQARIALDVGEDAVRFVNPLLPLTRSEIALPLRVGGGGHDTHILGVLDAQSTQVSAFDESHIATLQGMADQIAVALENARLFSQAQAALADNERLVAQVQANLDAATALYRLGQAISTAPDTPAIFAAIIENGLQPEIELALLALFDESQASAMQRIEISQVWTRAGSDIGDNVARLRAGAVSEFERFPLRPLLSNDPAGKILPCQDVAPELARSLPGLDTLAGVPLRVGARWIGTLVLGRAGTAAPGALGTTPSSDPQEAFGSWLQRYRAIATQVATAIDNHRLYERAQASLQELNTLYRTVTRQAWGRALEAQPHLSEYEYARASGLGTSGLSTSGGAARLELPLTLRGQAIGVIELVGENRTSWTEPERALAEAIVTQTALALDSARLFDETQRLAGRERLINEITARIRASTSVSGILQTAARELAQAINVPHAVARINPPADDDKSA